MRHVLLGILFLFLINTGGQSQIIDSFLGDESKFYAHTKQVNQFFRRFNGEEDQYGDRFSVNDKLYRDPKLRESAIRNLFDKQSRIIDPVRKEQFILDACHPSVPEFLDFHGGDWFAEVETRFLYQGSEYPLTFFLKLQEEEIGSKWVLTNVLFSPFTQYFMKSDEVSNSKMKFLHPLSHELDFMNLIKVFRENEVLEQYAERGYLPDYLTLFIYEFRKLNLHFVTIENVKFHFFQMPNWYFELAEFNRSGYNAGWLVSNLIRLSDEEKATLKKFMFQE